MALDLNKIQEKIKNFAKSENFLKNLFLGLALLAIILLLSALLMRNIASQNYGVLYSHLSPDDAGQILTVLQEEKIPYKIEGDGSIILVPKDKIYDIRLKLAAKGLPSSKTVGFEIFNEPKMGTTHFQENINYIRAIEGELVRTIKKIDAIKDAKVNIALPQDSIFAREEDEAKASVIVSLWPGKDLSKEQVKAIIFLVSHAVPKLKPQNVTVVDNKGRVLSDLVAQKDNEEAGDLVKIKRRLKHEIEKSVQSMLARALGPQKVVVRASVDVEAASVNKKDELVNPDQVAVISERKIQEKNKGYAKQQAGAPGTPTNVPATIKTNNQSLLQDKSKKDTTTNYDVSKSYIVTKQNIFKIKRISVGVLIDGKYIKQVDKNNSITTKYIPRSKEELKTYEQLIKSAIGYDPKRGDEVTVVSVPFESEQGSMEQESMGASSFLQKNLLLLGAIALLSLILLGLIIFMIMKAKRAKRAALEEAQLAQLQGQDGEAMHRAAQAAAKYHEQEQQSFSIEQEPAYQRIIEIAQESPELVADVISKWIKEEGK
ncbi:flagellar basal-body MS-ring/collar protein FliF [Nitratiruptor sp. YY09-18]|uniref:flagellar basal-body MS-ring/collar protein FliF n=1 Tax=Nitratiruptor sp. YY09-18 TaxID=2724901 RepID=UPI001915D70A|nr:flagellar basal-body MS-ring/collar protein FliF [Nitratiruptor sp. YY09-18]BCD68386.1 flagellar M-ring protein FliF [Nitratiruptor sp. YY09-18]